MPWLPLYADRNDFETVLARLNADPEVAFIVARGPGAWIARERLETVVPGRYCVWHVPSGPLPLLASKLGAPDDVVENPWAGWVERRPGLIRNIPFFGSPPGVFWLSMQPDGRARGALGLSGIEWIGNHYRILGDGAPDVTSRWWQRLGRWVRKTGVRVTRYGPLDGPQDGPPLYAWAFPSAYELLRAGTPRDLNP